MFNDHHWKLMFKREISKAQSAREQGNEGMARVCARRAAGVIVREYFSQNNILASNLGAYSLLRKMYSLQEISDDAREMISHFIVRITPEKTLPIEADLIQDAQWLAERLIE